MDTVTVDADAKEKNIGMIQGALFTRGSRVVDRMGRLHADNFFQDRYMLNEITAKIRLVRSKNLSASCPTTIVKSRSRMR